MTDGRQLLPVSRQAFTLHLIWAALLGAIGFYWIIKMLVVNASTNRGSAPMTIPIVFLAVLEYAFAFGWIKMRLSPLMKRIQEAVNAADAPGLFGQFTQESIIVMALIEAAAVYGLVHDFVVKSPQLFEVLGVVAVGLLFWFRSTYLLVAVQKLQELEKGKVA